MRRFSRLPRRAMLAAVLLFSPFCCFVPPQVPAQDEFEVEQEPPVWLRGLLDVRIVRGGRASSWTDRGPGKARYGGRTTDQGLRRKTRLALSQLAIEVGGVLPFYKGEDAPPVLFDKAGVVKIGCNIHDWMSAIILVLPTPYYATTDETGQFTLRDIPPGTYSFVCWHELSRKKLEETAQSVQVGGNRTEVIFTLPLGTPRVRPSVYGGRRYR